MLIAGNANRDVVVGVFLKTPLAKNLENTPFQNFGENFPKNPGKTEKFRLSFLDLALIKLD